MAKEKKEKPAKPRLEKYDKSKFVINGTFDQVIMAAFAKDKKPKTKEEK